MNGVFFMNKMLEAVYNRMQTGYAIVSQLARDFGKGRGKRDDRLARKRVMCYIFALSLIITPMVTGLGMYQAFADSASDAAAASDSASEAAGYASDASDYARDAAASASDAAISANAETVAETKADIEANDQALKEATEQGLITPDMLQKADPNTPVVSDEEFYAIVNRNQQYTTEEELASHNLSEPTSVPNEDAVETESSDSAENVDSNKSESNQKESKAVESDTISEDKESTKDSETKASESNKEESKVENSKSNDSENNDSKEESNLNETENIDTIKETDETGSTTNAPVAILSVFGVLSGALAGLLQIFK